MYKYLITLIFSLSLTVSYCQDTITYLSDAIKENINTYNKASNIAYEKNDIIEGKRLFDSLVKYKLVGTKFDDFNIKCFYSKNLKLNRIDKPIFIITYASWLVIPIGEIAALNLLAKEHRDRVQFIVLFWDKKATIKKIANKFSDDMKICYANENYKNDSHIIATIKHTLGFPTSFFIDENKNIVSIKHFNNKVKPKTPIVEAITISYNNFSKNINESLVNSSSNTTKITAN